MFPDGGQSEHFCRLAFRQRRKEAVPRPRNSSSTLAGELEAQGLRATVVAEALGTGKASVYRVLDVD